MARADVLHRWRHCGRKVGFLSRGAAASAARAIRPGSWFAVYRCRYCGAYHFGHRKGGKN